MSGKWHFSSAIPFSKSKTGLKGSFETCGIIGERPDAVILAFAGTDPGVWQNLATDFNALPTADTDKHVGFELAAGAAAAEVAQATQISRQSQKPLFITGHSLGAALAALAAQMAAAGGSPPRAVYTFGMPRVGGSKFQASYDASLGDVTYRLVHGVDLVARVPMSSVGFRHVGRLLECAAGAKFDATQPLSPVGSDDPPFAQEFANIFLRGANNILSGHILSEPGPGIFGPLFDLFRPRSAIICGLLLQGADVAITVLIRGTSIQASSLGENSRSRPDSYCDDVWNEQNRGIGQTSEILQLGPAYPQSIQLPHLRHPMKRVNQMRTNEINCLRAAMSAFGT